jgi:hypothetical protein
MKLRLATLGQMLANEDHSYHEIMHVARTRGGLDDYPDELPIGYTTLGPLDPDAILAAAKLPDFPGDPQIRSLGEMPTREQIVATAGRAHDPAGLYAQVLAKVNQYHDNPSGAKLEAVVTAIDAYIAGDKPKPTSSQSSKDKYEKRLSALSTVRSHCRQMLGTWKSFESLPSKEVTAFVQESIRGGGDAAKTRMGRLADVSGDHDDWSSPTFRAQSSDIDLDTTNMNFPVNPKIGIKKEEDRVTKGNLQADIQSFVEENRLVIEAFGRDVSDVPSFKPAAQLSPLMAKMEKSRLESEKAEVLNKAVYRDDPTDFSTNIDASTLAVLSPDAPIGGFLARFEGKPVPKELHALAAYVQPGYYRMMNYVMDERADKKFMATDAGQKWWREEVPVETKKLISLGVSALRKMKPYQGGTAYRGEYSSFIKEQIKKNILAKPKAEREKVWSRRYSASKTYDKFLSTAKRPYASYIKEQGRWVAVHITKVKSGVDISSLSNVLSTREVLFPPGTKFKVTNVADRFDARDSPGNRYNEAPVPKVDPGRIVMTMEEE